MMMRPSWMALAILGSLASCAEGPGGTSGSDCCCAPRAAAGTPAPTTQVIEKQYLKPAGSRTFAVEYVARISEIPPGARTLRIWLPVPQDSTVQTIKNVSFSQEPRIGFEPKYGNKIASFEIDHPGPTAQVTMKFACTRLEVRTDLEALRDEGRDEPESYGVFRRPDALVLVDDRLRAMSGDIVKGRTSTLDKARAIYDYVVSTMTYDKNHPGWGRGSTEHACQVGKGNCTDFHALFNSLCRAQGIPSGFEIGLYLPYDRGSQEKPGGYHCWAMFRIPGRTWVPVDCSEAARNPSRRDFFFGGHTSNRVTLATGRDLVLEPRQAGQPLNYFVNPYAEADGSPVKAEKDWSYRDLD